MNETNAKYARWIVRILHPRLINYKFKARGEEVAATKFQCLVVSDTPEQYAWAIIPFAFQNRAAPQTGMDRFLESSVWEMKTLVFDARSKADYNGAPLKRTLLLQQPTKLRLVNSTEAEAYTHPVHYVLPGLTLAEMMIGKKIQMQSGVRTVDFVAKIKGMSAVRPVVVQGFRTTVMDVEVIDDSKLPNGNAATCTVAVWGGSIKLFDALMPGKAASFFGCTLVRTDANEIKINMNEGSACLMTNGPRVALLENMVIGDMTCESVTVAWAPSSRPIDVSGDAVYTCAASMAGLKPENCSSTDDVVFQVNRALLDFSTERENIFTQDGTRLFAKGTIHDWTGPVQLAVVETAVPKIFGLDTKAEVLAALEQNSLTTVKDRVNLRGVRRLEGNVIRFLVADVVEAPCGASLSMSATRNLLGLADVLGDVAVPAPMSAITMCPLLGLAVVREDGQKIGAYRVLSLVQGNKPSKLAKFNNGEGDAYLVESAQVKCLLSDTDTRADLRGYCNFDTMLQYRLDKEVALAFISASTGDSTTIFTIDHMAKVPPGELEAVQKALKNEAAIALASPEMPTKTINRTVSPSSGRKVRRITLEPSSPPLPIPATNARD